MAGSHPDVSRREFVKTLGAAALATTPIVGAAARAVAGDVGPTRSAPAETAVARFYTSLKDEQRKLICFPFDTPSGRRSRTTGRSSSRRSPT